jgi:hypothetical protein
MIRQKPTACLGDVNRLPVLVDRVASSDIRDLRPKEGSSIKLSITGVIVNLTEPR